MKTINDLRDRALEIRNRFTEPGVTGEEKIRLTDELVKIETQITNGTVNPDQTQPEHFFNEPSPDEQRQNAVRLAEQLEEKGDEVSLAKAKGVRQSIIHLDLQQHDQNQLHAQFVEDGEARRNALDEAYQTRLVEQQVELDAASEAERSKQL